MIRSTTRLDAPCLSSKHYSNTARHNCLQAIKTGTVNQCFRNVQVGIDVKQARCNKNECPSKITYCGDKMSMVYHTHLTHFGDDLPS